MIYVHRRILSPREFKVKINYQIRLSHHKRMMKFDSTSSRRATERTFVMGNYSIFPQNFMTRKRENLL